MSYNMMTGYDIYDCFTMEHFRLRQRMTLTTKIYCSRLYVPGELSFTARAKTPTTNQFKILKKFRNDCVSLQNNL
jgi:hypothetical protein